MKSSLFLKGVMPALVTPLTKDEKLNVPVLSALMERHISEGAYGFYIGGATGEGISLPPEVREELAYESVKAVKGRVPVIIHVASTVFPDAVRLAKQAEACGADMISAIPPLFYGYSEDDVFNYYKRLASSVNIPLMVYYNPNAGFKVQSEFAARLFEIDNVSAIKWTSSDYFGMLRLKELTHGEMNVINGPDEMLLMGLASGADGGIGSTYNYMLPVIRSIYEYYIAGDIDKAREAQKKADRSISALLPFGVISAVKAVLEYQGYAVGNPAFPLRSYSEEEKKKIFGLVAGML